MATRELLHVGFVIEAPRLYPVLRLLEQAKAYNVEVRVFELGEMATADEAPRKRNRPGATGETVNTAGMRERVLDLIIQAGPAGIRIADIIKAIGATRKGGIYQAANYWMIAGKIERPSVGLYRLVNGAGVEATDQPPASAAVAAGAAAAAPSTAKFEAVLAHLADNGEITTADIRRILKVDKNAGDFAIKQLIAAKAMRRTGRGVYARA